MIKAPKPKLEKEATLPLLLQVLEAKQEAQKFKASLPNMNAPEQSIIDRGNQMIEAISSKTSQGVALLTQFRNSMAPLVKAHLASKTEELEQEKEVAFQAKDNSPESKERRKTLKKEVEYAEKTQAAIDGPIEGFIPFARRDIKKDLKALEEKVAAREMQYKELQIKALTLESKELKATIKLLQSDDKPAKNAAAKEILSVLPEFQTIPEESNKLQERIQFLNPKLRDKAWECKIWKADELPTFIKTLKMDLKKITETLKENKPQIEKDGRDLV
jgi:hypothetical protein